MTMRSLVLVLVIVPGAAFAETLNDPPMPVPVPREFRQASAPPSALGIDQTVSPIASGRSSYRDRRSGTGVDVGNVDPAPVICTNCDD